jgi:hypothetical protein
MLPLFMPISLALFYVAINPLWSEVDAIMKSGFQTAAAQMTEYSAIRESSILSMFEQAQFDRDYAERWQGDIFHYVLDKRWDPVKKEWIYNHYVYDLTESPVAPSLKRKNKIPRYAAWYWSERYPKVTEAGLTKEIKTFIDALVKITEFNTWDTPTWMYTAVSLKVNIPDITCQSGECPEWAVPEKGIVRILSHVTQQEPTDIFQWLMNLIFGNGQQGFLPVKFTELTNRLLATPIYSGQITWTTNEIAVVTEALRGMMLRDMELLNIPIAHRIPSINSWLPVWYNKDDHSQDIYTRLQTLVDGGSVNGGTIVGISAWIDVLSAINPNIQAIVPEPNGNCLNGTGSDAGDCSNASCCAWDDSGNCICACRCCGSHTCTWYGTFCSCSPELHTNLGFCGHGDVYGEKSDCASLPNRTMDCPCGDCTGPEDPSSESVQACRYQGQLNWAGGGPTEIAQAIEILENLRTEIEDLRTAIKIFADKANAIMYPDAATAQLQREAIYGWMDTSKPDRSSLNIVRVNLDNYPSRDVFPYIKEGYEFFGFIKFWSLEGQTNGSVGQVTVQRYTSDIWPGSWWTFRYRKNPGAPEWPVGDLGSIVDGIQRSGTPGGGAAGLDTYGITSATKGHYGMNKEDIYIERVK